MHTRTHGMTLSYSLSHTQPRSAILATQFANVSSIIVSAIGISAWDNNKVCVCRALGVISIQCHHFNTHIILLYTALYRTPVYRQGVPRVLRARHLPATPRHHNHYVSPCAMRLYMCAPASVCVRWLCMCLTHTHPHSLTHIDTHGHRYAWGNTRLGGLRETAGRARTMKFVYMGTCCVSVYVCVYVTPVH
jgi:hypothetical protein